MDMHSGAQLLSRAPGKCSSLAYSHLSIIICTRRQRLGHACAQGNDELPCKRVEESYSELSGI